MATLIRSLPANISTVRPNTVSRIDPVVRILQGYEHVVSFPGRSQYGPEGGGVSACGLAALNFARLMTAKDVDGFQGEKILREMMKQEMAEDILRICLGWSSSHHLDVDEICEAPIFKSTLAPLWSEYEQPGESQFQSLLKRLQSAPSRVAAAIITRPPEIISVLKVSISTSKDVFVIFDSHPRRKHPDGAAFIFYASPDAAARYLGELLQYDPRLLADSAMQWQAQLLAHYSAHAFVAAPQARAPSELEDAALDASLVALELRAEVAHLRGQNRLLEADNTRLGQEVERLEEEMDTLKEQLAARPFMAAKGKEPMCHKPPAPTADTAWMTPRSALFDEPSGSSSRDTNYSSSQIISTDAWTTRLHKDDDTNTAWMTPKNAFASRLDPPGIIVGHSSPPVFSTRTPSPPFSEDDDYTDALLAAQAQAEFEREDAILRAQALTLRQEVPATFECGICMEEEPEWSVARFEPCGHPFCRDCIRDYIRGKINEHRYPILCPICATNKQQTNPGRLDGTFVQNIGLGEKEYATFSELELAAFSIHVNCRKCKGSAFVDRTEHQAAKLLTCPLPNCNHVWCKQCSQTVETGVNHSCDGSSEINHLINQQGWQRCPGCQTPTEKTQGCNHMTCTAPGCGTHFCYICGQRFARGVYSHSNCRRA